MKGRTIHVYCARKTKRLHYTLRVIFTEWANVPYTISHEYQANTDLEILDAEEAPRGAKSVKVRLVSDVLNDGQLVSEIPYTATPEFALFPVDEPGFERLDVISAVFWFISRMEEQLLSTTRDAHGRFVFQSSLLSKLGVSAKPWLEIWLIPLYEKLGISPANKNSRSLGFDLDNAFVFKGKALYRRLGLAIKLGLKGDFRAFLAGFGIGKDPHDIYSFLKEQKPENQEWTFFIPVARRSEWDRNLDYSTRVYQELVRWLGGWAKIGVHLSYTSHQVDGGFKVEVDRLSGVLNKPVTKNRFHFLKQTLPMTWRKLESAGIQEDYSLGFPDAMGFRAGVSWPFQPYDIGEERILNLMVYPFVIMDEGLRGYQNWTPEELGQLDVALPEYDSGASQHRWVLHPDLMGGVFQWTGYAAAGKNLIQRISGRSI
ncbi:MAG: hypothetical protein ACJAY8_000686 [Sphingobacteriales bacterium]|jgi:hypothetical protein